MAWKILLFIGAIALCSKLVSSASEQEKLLAHMFTSYDRNTPPSAKFNESVKVKFGLSLVKIINVEEQQNSISLMTWLKMEFNDYRLQWDKEKNSGISTLRVPYDKIWIPDIVLFNGLAGSQFFESKVMAILYYTGFVYALPPMQLTASCDMDLTFFPYDTQECRLKFGSWTYDKSIIELELMMEEVDLGDYSEHPEWKLLNATFELNSKKYPCCNETYMDATAVLKIERRSEPYAVKLVIPSVLTAFLILFTFILPSSSGEKIVFCLILLLSLILLSVYLHISVPSNTESILGEFLTFALFLDFFATIIAVICYNVADALLMRDKLGGPESDKHWTARKRKLKILRIMEYVFFFLFLIMFIIGTAVILCRRG